MFLAGGSDGGTKQHNMKTHLAGRAVLVLLLAACANAGNVIHVPADQPSIQAGIDASANGDTVLVAAGVYYEIINFHGKAIIVTSEQGAGLTVIDGQALDSVATFVSGEGLDSVLAGFTLQNGRSGFDTPGFGSGEESESEVRPRAFRTISSRVIARAQAPGFLSPVFPPQSVVVLL
jgi:hypothetical protein